MASLQLDLSGKEGLAPRFWGDIDRTTSTPELRYIGKKGQMADGIYNPFRRYGYMSPSNAAFNTVTVTGGSNASAMGSTIYDRLNNDYYMATRGADIYKGDGLDDTALALSVALSATGTPVIMDLEIYQVNEVRKLFYVYEKGDDVEVGIATLPFASNDDDWISTAPANPLSSQGLTNDAFMRVADNGFAYLLMDNQVHKIDGTSTGGANGTITANALLFPTDFQIVDGIDYRGFMFLAIHQNTDGIRGGESVRVLNSKVGVYIWDRLTTVVNTRDFIPLEGVKEIRNMYVSPQGDLRLVVVNSERTTEIRQYTGAKFEIIEEVGLSAYPQFHDSLEVVSNSTMWLGIDGNIYAHGKISFRDNESIYKIGNLPEATAGSGIQTGAILFGGSNTDSSTAGFKITKNGLFMSYIDSSSNKDVVEWDIYGTGADGVSALQEQGDVYTIVKLLPQMSTLTNAEIYCFPIGTTGSSTAATIKFYANQSSTAFKTKTVTRDEASRGYVNVELNKPFVNSLQIEIEFSSSTAIGTSDFAPSTAVINYEPTRTKG